MGVPTLPGADLVVARPHGEAARLLTVYSFKRLVPPGWAAALGPPAGTGELGS